LEVKQKKDEEARIAKINEQLKQKEEPKAAMDKKKGVKECDDKAHREKETVDKKSKATEEMAKKKKDKCIAEATKGMNVKATKNKSTADKERRAVEEKAKKDEAVKANVTAASFICKKPRGQRPNWMRQSAR